MEGDAPFRCKLDPQPGQEGVLRPLAAGATIELAVYEAVNAVWRGHCLLGRIDKQVAAGWIAFLTEVFSAIPVYALSDLGELGEVLAGIFGLAASEEVTVYDASYVYAAKARRLALVTDDARPRNAAGKHVGTLTSAQLLA